MPGRIEVGLADAETDHIVHRADDIEEIADARTGQVVHMRGDALTG
jgi:hypothetical protein